MSLLRRISLRRAVAAVAVVALAATAAVLGAAHTAAARASAATGVVAIDTNLGYEGSAAAGTGIVLTSNGEVLTNNHVIRGATSIRVVVPSTGRSYPARAVGYDIAADVAVLQLRGASGLATVSLGNSAKARPGGRVTAVGNAGGTGSLVATSGRIAALGRTITASDGESAPEQLRGLIQTSARLQPGDSGGPLLDAASGRVIGIDTAASAGFAFRSAGGEGYAIPIDRALSVAQRIVAGRASASVHVGATAFLGVSIQPAGGYGGSDAGGVLVGGVVSGSPADRAGLTAGAVITAANGRAVASPASLVTLLQRLKPGGALALTWYDRLGSRSTATVRLVSGPPQ